jgi:hypothetical protein
VVWSSLGSNFDLLNNFSLFSDFLLLGESVVNTSKRVKIYYNDCEEVRMYLPNLIDRANLAINCLTGLTDKKRGYLPYFYTRLMDRPISSSLDFWSYGDGLGRSVDALTLLRTMTSGSIDEEPDRIMRGTLINLMGIDGLSWCPAEPWTAPFAHTRPAWLQQGTLLALTSLYLATGDQEYRRLAEMNIQAVKKMTTFHPEGYGDYPGDYYTRVNGWSEPPNDPMHRASVFSTSITMPLMRYFHATGYEPALELATGLIAWALRDHDDGRRLFDLGHFHCQSRLVTAILLRGVTTNNSADMELGEKLYLKARSLGTQSGWFPEQINNPEHNRSNLSETCCLTDMLESAILLAQHYSAGYWNDVERYVKNHLLVHQITRTDWFDALTYLPPEKREPTFNTERLRMTDACILDERMRKAIIGGFAGWGAVTTMSDDSLFSNSNQHCCNAAGARAIFDGWRYAVSDVDGFLTVNIHIHRSHAAADVTMEEGSGGKLSIQMKADRQLCVRIPEFLTAGDMKIIRDGKAVNCPANGTVVEVGPCAAGSRIEISYPMKERISKETLAPGTFTFHWRGSTVVAAEPIKGVEPLFVDSRFEKSSPVTKNIPEKEIESI